MKFTANTHFVLLIFAITLLNEQFLAKLKHPEYLVNIFSLQKWECRQEIFFIITPRKTVNNKYAIIVCNHIFE